ncbi:MAG: hypothetical protein ACTHU0_02985 [Kofleriaceae bacterium]
MDGRVEALVIARAHATRRASSSSELVKPLWRYTPPTMTSGAWSAWLEDVVSALRARDVLDADHRLRDPDQLARAIGRHAARSWRQLTDRVLPALGLAIAPDDARALSRLIGRDAWAAAIAGRALGLWTAGPPMSTSALCDALAWRGLGLAGAPKRCPPEIRALFAQRELGCEAGPPDRLVRQLAARALGAARPDLRVLRDALVCRWLTGHELASPPPFAREVREAASATHHGVFGDRKVFIASVWRELCRHARWVDLPLAEFKRQLVVAHRAGDLSLARADLVAAMDPELVAASETVTDGASFHFIVREASS